MEQMSKRIMGKPSTSPRRKNRGMTLVELAIVIGVIGIIAVLALRGTNMLSKSKGMVEGQNMLDTVTGTISCFSKAQDFTALGATTATGTTYVTANCGPEIANPPAVITGGTISNQFGGSRTIARTSILSGTNNAIIVANALLPTNVCQEIVQSQWDNYDVITITPTGGAAVVAKATLATAYTPAAMIACTTAVNATIAVTKAKN